MTPCLTSDVVPDPSPEAAPPGDEDPFKDLPVDTARLHHDDWIRDVKDLTEHTATAPGQVVPNTVSQMAP